MKIEIFVSRSVRTGGVVRLQPSTGVERESESSLLGLDDANNLVRRWKAIPKRYAFCTGRQINFEPGAIGVVKDKSPLTDYLIHPRMIAGEQFVDFAVIFCRSLPIKNERPLKILII